MTLMQEETAKFLGLGFVTGPSHKYTFRWYVSDRVPVSEIAIPNLGEKFTVCRVINDYGPTMQKVTENPAVRNKFYAGLSSAVAASSCFQVFVKLGQLTPEVEEAG